jgi:hypothetical protein
VSEVARDLRDRRKRRASLAPRPDQLRQLWFEGLESGEPVEAGLIFERLLDKFRIRTGCIAPLSPLAGRRSG